MEEKKESIGKSFATGLLTGLFCMIPTGSMGALYSSEFLQNGLEKKPNKRWIWCILMAIIGLFLGSWSRLIKGVEFLETNFPLASYLLFLIATIGLACPIIYRDMKRKDKTVLELCLYFALLLVGACASFGMNYFIKNESNAFITNEYLLVLVTGFVLGFAALLPGLPISPLMKMLESESYMKTVMLNIPDRVEVTKSIGLIAVCFIGMLLNVLIFYYPYRLLFKKIKNVCGGLFSGLIIGSAFGGFFAHGEFTLAEYPKTHYGEVQNIAEWGFAFAGVILMIVLFVAFAHINHSSDSGSDKLALYDKYGKAKKSKFRKKG